MNSVKLPPSTKVAITSVFTALVCLVTMMFSIYVPQTEGFFNVGESMVYITAILFGPVIGAFAGGVGSMFADLILGYPHYAPATLVIKACEGAIVGSLSRKTPKMAQLHWKTVTLLIAIIPGALLSVIGASYYSGNAEMYLGYPAQTLNIFIPAEAWYVLGGVIIVLIASIGLTTEPKIGWLAISLILGGLEMVAGYFIYQQFLGHLLFPEPFKEVYAVAELPVNIGQMIIGIIVAIPTVRAAWRYLPTLQSRGES